MMMLRCGDAVLSRVWIGSLGVSIQGSKIGIELGISFPSLASRFGEGTRQSIKIADTVFLAGNGLQKYKSERGSSRGHKSFEEGRRCVGWEA